VGFRLVTEAGSGMTVLGFNTILSMGERGESGFAAKESRAEALHIKGSRLAKIRLA